MFQLRKATRTKAKIRLGLSAISGGGKTYSAILIAKGLVGDLSKVAIIDTENGSADLYQHLGDYNVLTLDAPFSPERYISAIEACEKAGMECIIVDSITHEWDGKGGCLEIQESLGGKYQDWAKVTPRHQKFVSKMLESPAHIITTVRRKQDYEMAKDASGKVKVEKSGLKEVTREGWEYELTINLQLDQRHNATASKDRTGLFIDKPEFVPGEATGEMIRQWCEAGAEVPKSAAPEEAPAPVPATKPVPKGTAYKTQSALEVALGQTYDLDALLGLFTANEQMIAKNAAIKALFTARKAQIKAGTLQKPVDAELQTPEWFSRRVGFQVWATVPAGKPEKSGVMPVEDDADAQNMVEVMQAEGYRFRDLTDAEIDAYTKQQLNAS